MVRSMYSGVSGLKSHQTRMDVIGNNIANVNTYGFKAGRVTFRDVYYQTLSSASGPTAGAKASGGVNSNQVGYGTSVGSIDTMHTRSGFQFTDQGFDVAIAGEGYFQVQDPDGNRFFTRAGILNIDPSGNVVDANGYFVLGADANIMTAEVPPKSATAGVSLDGIMALATANPPGKATNDITVSYTYDASKTGAGDPAVTGTWTGKSLSVVIGPNAFNLTTATPPGFATVGSTTPGELTAAEMKNMMDAAMAGANAGLGANAPPLVPGTTTPIAVVITIEGALATDLLTQANLEDGVAKKGMTKGGADIGTSVQSDMYATAGDATSGSKPADIKPINILDLMNQALKGKPGVTGDIQKNEFTGVGIAKDGTIMGKHPKYGDVVLGRIDVSTFANPNGLTQEGNNYFASSANSGNPIATIPGKDGSGDLVSGALEMSNVDLSGQFTDMIVTQRGFQANSRVITTTDEMLAELINLKR